MVRANQSVWELMKQKHVTQWMLADKLGIHESTVIRHMRHELSEPDKQKYLAAIEEVAREMEEDGRKTEA